jgi:hypothetical protein
MGDFTVPPDVERCRSCRPRLNIRRRWEQAAALDAVGAQTNQKALPLNWRVRSIG